MIKEILKNNILDFYIKKYSKQERVCKDLFVLNSDVNEFINNLFTFNSIPSVQRLSNINSTEINDLYEKIEFILNGIYSCAEKLKSDYKEKINSYMAAYSRIETLFGTISNDVYSLLEYNCINIPTRKSNQGDNSNCSNIGKYIILPFFRKVASMYNDTIQLNYYTSDDLVFTNIYNVTSIPITEFIAFKIASQNDTINPVVTLQVNEFLCNMVYIKMSNNVNKVDVTLKYNNSEIDTYEYNTNEILINFSPTTIDALEISIECRNLNKDKPISIQIEDLQLFKNMVFSKNGTFESNVTEITNFSNIDNIKMSHNKYGDSDYTNSTQLLSVSSSESIVSYNKIDDNSIDISLYKYKHIFDIDSASNTYDLTIHNKSYIGCDYTQTDEIWNADIKKSRIFYGINNYYLSQDSITSDKRFGTWTLSGNYYITYILNYEDDVYVNIGNKTCILNNKEVTGVINIPVGVSKVLVHTKDINLFSTDDTFILNKSKILADKLYPYNFTYLFSGLPEYLPNGNIAPKIQKGPYKTSENMAILLKESFIPFTEVIIDDANRVYKLQLTKSTDLEGTYTIEPYNGIIRITPYASSNYITVSYNRSQYNNKPCGILFNRLLTYAPLETILVDDNSELFSVDGDNSSRVLILPQITPPMQNSQLIFNKEDEKMFMSAKINLETKDKYLTPMVSDIYVQTR